MALELDFNVFKTAVATQFAVLAKHGLLRIDVSKDELWDTYLNSYPPEVNKIYKERREYDCNCCKSFIRAVGNVAAIINGKLVSIWDIEVSIPAFQQVANAMLALVKSKPIQNMFLHTEPTAGVDKSLAKALDGKVLTWRHFFVNLPKGAVVGADQIGPTLSNKRGDRDVFKRGLDEITVDAIDTVMDLIAQKLLYKGDENKFVVESFLKLKKDYDKFTGDKDVFVWDHVLSGKVPASVLRIRNTSIGTLLQDLSEGVDLEEAVKKFEVVVAPHNYNRPKALVTKQMIEQAKAKIVELGLGSALERRYATLADITVNNVLFVNRATKAKITADPFEKVMDSMAAAVPVKPTSLDNLQDVPIDTFIKDYLPRAEGIELLVENRHNSNFMSLIAPSDPTAAKLFKWNNGFSWSYNGEVADSVRERVIAKGGRVDGVLRFSHSWNHIGRNASLMDLHVFMPGSTSHRDGSHDRYPSGPRVGWNNRSELVSGGRQDVDYVDVAPEGYVPVENITFPDLRKLKDGTYTFKIHNWALRPPTTSGFKAEIEFEGQVFEYDYPKPLGNKEWVTVATAELKNGKFTINHKLQPGSTSREVWAINTQTFVPVNSIMLSPNYWDEQGVGNKHWFFMLQGCKNPGTARGFYNEFLKEELSPHRKVLEMVGSKMKTEASDNQLSGLGFSSTQRNSVKCRITGKFSRIINIVF